MGVRYASREFCRYRLGRNLKTARTVAGWTQEELARNLNTKQPNVARWETGALVPTIPRLMEIKFLLGIDTIDWLLYHEDGHAKATAA